MKISPRNKLLLVIGAFVLAVIIAIAVLIVPTVTKMSQIDQRVAEAEQEQTSAKTLLDRRREVRDRAVQNDAELLQLANALPDSPELPSLIVELQDRAYDSGVIIRSLQPVDPVQKAGTTYVDMPLSIVIWGAWDDTIDYLQGLQKMSRLVRVNDFRSEVIDEETRKELEPELAEYDIQTTMQITTYVLPATDASATAPVPAPAQ